jgi:hypothetical protein
MLHYFGYVASKGGMIYILWIVKHLDGSSHGMYEGITFNNWEKPQKVLAMIARVWLRLNLGPPNTKQKCQLWNGNIHSHEMMLYD